MKKIIMSVAALSATVALVAAEAPKNPEEQPLAGAEISGQIKAMHILSDKTDNTYAPNNGSGYLATLKVLTQDLGIKGLKAGAALYINGDTGLTEWESPTATDKSAINNALGMFTGEGKGDTTLLIGQAYLDYKSSMVDAKIGRQILNTPLTTIQWSLLPNFYEAGVLTLKPMKGLSLTAAHIESMSYGSRSATDWMVVGEGTRTAGVVNSTIAQGGSRAQANFINLGEGAGLGTDTNGMAVVSATYKMGENFRISLWDYFVHDIANNIYADLEYKMPVMEGTALTLNAQYLSQDEMGDKLAGTLNYSMYGVKAKVGNKKWSAYLAYNKSADKDNDGNNKPDGGFFNAWGADPAYTSSIFSRNAYRQDVKAYKIGGHYAIMKGLKVMVSHADYGQSKTKGLNNTVDSQKDGVETNIVVVYKPTKDWMFKVFNARKTSEYDIGTSATNTKKMDHYRAVASYDF